MSGVGFGFFLGFVFALTWLWATKPEGTMVCVPDGGGYDCHEPFQWGTP